MKFIKDKNLPSLKEFRTAESAANELAEEILDYSTKIILKKGRCTWAMSGGSSIMKLYDALNRLTKPNDGLWKHLIVCWVDERHVPHEHNESNFGNAYRCFWNQINGSLLIPVPYYQSPGISVEEYQKNLSAYGIGQTIDIDFLILGMGADGHTASLFPNKNTYGVWDSDKYVISTEHKGMARISLNYSLLNRSEKIRFFAYGAEKGTTFNMAIEEMNRDKYPFLGINKYKSLFYVDHTFYEAAQTSSTK
jgi:6-phosphogluconolactonase